MIKQILVLACAISFLPSVHGATASPTIQVVRIGCATFKEKLQKTVVKLASLKNPEEKAVIFDIDGTAIALMKDYEIDHARPAIFELLEAYNILLKEGFKVFFITARTGDRKIEVETSRGKKRTVTIHQLTERALKVAGYETYEELFCMPERAYLAGYKEGSDNSRWEDTIRFENIALWKALKRATIASEYKIVAIFDDQAENLEGEDTGTPVLVPSIIFSMNKIEEISHPGKQGERRAPKNRPKNVDPAT